MARGALVWEADGRLQAARLATNLPTLVGRMRGAGVPLAHPTVSRRHAVIYARREQYFVEHLSASSPTWLNGRAVAAADRLQDGDVLRLGDQRLTFHDLAAGDRPAGPLCPWCERENTPEERYCWYCGTAMLGAATVIHRLRRVVGRLVATDGQRFDLYPDEAWSVRNGQPRVARRGRNAPAEAVLVVAARREVRLQVTPPAPTVRLNDRPQVGTAVLATGDLLDVAGQAYVALIG